ncbi:MAG: protein kinase [bacterium]|nr:protein kinase [bacterium]
MSVPLASTASIGTDRFLIREKLGAGAFGDVFRAYDRELETTVALKTLHRADPAAFYHFKNEFRSLAGVTHPNLVQLYELVSEGDRWFFTMELVEGLDFIEHAGASAEELTETTQVHPLTAPVVQQDFDRLRRALHQLAEGLCALHRAGKLHCDIKPPNVRITAEGRLVLLDFGLVYDLGGERFQTMEGEVRGTPAYMAPEQALGRTVTEASDWYAVGGVLYEALTGELPFSGSVLRVLQEKQLADGPSPRKLVPYLPDDLAELCEDLLRRDPADRPTGAQVLDRLGGGWTPLPELGAARDGKLFVGREPQLAALHDAFASTREGRAVAAFICGASGMGKTALVGRFVEQVRRRHPNLVVLGGRCYERESVPYKGLDALLDTLSRYLKQLPFDEAAALVPVHVRALARLFPALLRVEAVAAASRDGFDAGDELEQRRRARAALRQLLERLSLRLPVLLFIDDLQWGDRDSADMLADLLAPPNPPAVMLIGCTRHDGVGDGPVLRRLLRDQEDDSTGGPIVTDMAVHKLWFSEAVALATKLLGERRAQGESLPRAIAVESRGSPFFVTELVRYARSELGAIEGDGGFVSTGLSLEGLIRNRLARLPAGARRLLELVAIAGRPLALEVALAAGGLGRESQAAVKLLLARSLVRMRSSPRRELVTYHDLIRENVLRGMGDASQSRLHRLLADDFEAGEAADPETLALHFEAAGDSRRATELVTVAARKAVDALAFERAVRLYRLALELELTPPVRHNLRVELAFALVNAGRRAEAANAYLAAADDVEGHKALELRRRACEQQFFGGDFAGCRSSLETVLASIGLRLPESSTRALASFCGHRFLFKLRRPRFRARPANEVPRERSWQLDVLWSAFIVSMRNPFRSMDFQARYQLLAIEVGHPAHLVHALAIETAISAVRGVARSERTARLLSTTAGLAERLDDPNALAEVSYAGGFAALFESRLKSACDLLERSETLWRDHGTDFFWGSSRVAVLLVHALVLSGRLRDVGERLPGLLKDVAEKGNVYDEADLRSRASCVARLAADRPLEAAREIARAEELLDAQVASELWSYTGFHRLHFYHLLGRVEIELYRNRGQEAWSVLDRRWRRARWSLYFRVQLMRAEIWSLRCRAALAALAALGGRSRRARRLEGRITRGLRRLEAEGLTWTDAFVGSLRAGLATLDGRDSEAIGLLTTAEARFESADFALHAAVCRRRRGQLLDTAGGRELVLAADTWMSGQGIRSPRRMSRVLVPGLWSPHASQTRSSE